MTRTMGASFALILVLGVFVLGGCASSKEIPAAAGQEEVVMDELAGDWLVVSVMGNGTEKSVPDGVFASFSADSEGNGKYAVYGFAGVNNYNAAVAVSGASFSAGDIATTMMAGSPAAEQFERIFLDVLASADTVTFSADSKGAVVGDGTGRNAVIMRRQGLGGTSWVLTASNTGGAVASLPQVAASPELSFGADGSVAGFTGVNYLTGEYRVDNASRALSFPQLGTTRMAAADEDAASMEQSYLDLLGKCAVYQLSGDVLRLLDKGGTTLLVFARK